MPAEQEVLMLGYGRMGAYLGGALAQLAEARVVAVADPSPAGRDRARAALGAAVELFDTPQRAIEECTAGACVIATPTPTHAGLTRLALEAGMHVFCEKPLCFSPEDSDELALEAARRGLTLQVGFFRRFSAPWVAARDAVRAGAVGRVSFIRSSTWDQVVPPLGFLRPSVSGGLLVDNGVHEFDVVPWLAGSPVTRVAAVGGPDSGHGIADAGDLSCAAVLLELADGTIATIDLSRNARYADDMRTEILGSDGAVFVDYHPVSAARLGTVAGLREVPGSRVDDGFLAGVREELRAFARAAAGEPLELPDGHDNARAMRVAAAVQRATVEGQWVPVPAAPIVQRT